MAEVGIARRSGLAVAAFALLWLGGELAVSLFTLAWTGSLPALDEPVRVLRATPGRAEASDGLEVFAAEVVHPYLGFVGNPRLAAPQAPKRNAFGFVDEKSPLEAGRPGALRVALVGGSVAERFGLLGADHFERVLGERLGGRPVELVKLGQSGFKQPQQLLAIVWLLSLGARFDVWVALDGFNEVALHGPENAQRGVAPSYPRNWAIRVAGLPDPEALTRRGLVAARAQSRADWAEIFAAGPLRWSPAAQVLWRWRDRRLAAAGREAEDWLRSHRPAEARYAVQGPAYFQGPPDEPMDALVRIWERSSLQLHRLAAANGARYLHFLQPNQYFPDTKPMDEAERAVAMLPDHPYRPGAVEGHPRLLAAGARLNEAGVAFRDATGVFRGVEEPVFVDACCHMNARGHAILGEFMAREIAELVSP